MLCFSVDSPESLENVESKWVGEIAENCPNVKLVLVALKCDLREQSGDHEDDSEPKRPCIDYKQGLAVAEKIKALRYLGMSSRIYYLHGRRIRRRLTEMIYRMLRQKESRRERSFYRSSAGGIDRQNRKSRQAKRIRPFLHCDVRWHFNPSRISVILWNPYERMKHIPISTRSISGVARHGEAKYTCVKSRCGISFGAVVVDKSAADGRRSRVARPLFCEFVFGTFYIPQLFYLFRRYPSRNSARK